MTNLKEGDVAPEFSLQDQNGKPHKLSDYKGNKVLLYFYPKDDTPGCTIEARTLGDLYKEYKKDETIIIGISTDSVESHKKFAKKYKLPFLLLADTEKTVVNAYGVYGEKRFMGKKYIGISRESFLIGENGKILKVYEKVKPKTHAKEVLEDIKSG